MDNGEKRINIMDNLTYFKKFKKLFTDIDSSLHGNEYIDTTMTLALGSISFDIVKFDDKLMANYPDEFTDGISLKEFVQYKFGKGAVNFLEEML
jgi:hypothetical protein